jgi:hypothetical protein
MPGRPWDLARYNYGGKGQLSECGVTANMLSAVMPAPTEGEEVFVLELAYKVGHSGNVPRIEIQDIDGLTVWAEGIGATDVWNIRTFPKPGKRIPTKQGKVVFSNTALSVAEVWVDYQIM